MVGSLVFLTPYGGLVACALLVPLAGLALAARRERRGRELLGLPPPPPGTRLPRLIGLVAVPALLGLAASQPALRSQTNARIRTDAQAIYVIDTSRSMLAAAGPDARERIARAKADAIAMREALAEIPSGVATFTDRVLPDLLPDSDPAVFASTVTRAVGVAEPPPSTSSVVATSFGALGALGTQNFFPPSATRRLVVLLTDGESRPFDPGQIAHDLASGPGIHLVVIHVSAPGERVYDQGRPEQGYHEDSASGQELASLALASGGTVFGEGSLGAAIARARRDLGSGPSQLQGTSGRTRTLAPYAALLALLPLLALLRPGRTRLAWRELLAGVRGEPLTTAAPQPGARATPGAAAAPSAGEA